MNPTEQYIHDRDMQVRKNLTDHDLWVDTMRFTEAIVKTNYVKNFTYCGIPILQYPTDLMVMQELIWEVKPRWIVETGVAFGGMTRFYADMLSAIQGNSVIPIDIEIRPHAREALNARHIAIPIEASSIAEKTIDIVKEIISRDSEGAVLVSLDSNHTHNHVLQELKLYSPLVSVGSYIVVFDTAIEFYGHLDKNQDRAWGKGNNPWTATQEFLKTEMGKNFVVDKEVEQRALITSAPDGFLRRIK